MNLKKQVKGGVLLYALLMSMLFVLVLQVYLFKVVSSERLHQKQVISSEAYVMAYLTQKKASEDKGQFQFNKGISDYHSDRDRISVRVTTKDGSEFSYHFLKDGIQ